MIRAASLVGAVLAASLLAGCGGPSPYCAAVEKGQKTLNTFGAKRTDAAFGSYAKTASSVAKQAPAKTRKQWTKLADVTQGVIDAHAKVGIKLEDMDDEKARAGLDEGDITLLNAAYAAFNDVIEQNKPLVDDVQKTCDITLK